jgi:hypothetical protein
MKFASVCLFAASASLLYAQYAGTQPVPQQFRKGVDAISIDNARKNLTYLSVDCEGRGSGQPGFQKAAEYMAAKFKEAGLKPVGDNGTYFQNVPFVRTSIDAAKSFIATEDGATKVIGETNLSFGRLGADVDKTAPVVIIRANGSNAKLPSTDALAGKIVIVAQSGDSRDLSRQIRQASTVAVIRIEDKLARAMPAVRPAGGRGGGGSTSLNFMSMNRAAAERLCQGLMEEASVLDANEAPDGTAELIDAKTSLHIFAKAATDTVNVPNVVGLLEGSDPTLKNELVGIGAHLDHLGWQGDTVYPGADDDGSGSTALLEIVRAMHLTGAKPKRSILFMAFCGEEMGLIGSGYYSDHPIFPHDQMIAELQMDMVGRDSDGIQNGDRNRVDKKEENVDTMRLVGSKRISTDLHNLIESTNKYIGFKFKWDAEDVYTRSDHYNFAKHGIPIAFLFDGFHPDYHQPTDTVEKINFTKLTNAAKLYYMVALELANNPTRPRKDVPQEGGG